MDLDPFAINMNEFAELDSNVEVDTEVGNYLLGSY